MALPQWSSVDDYLTDTLVPSDPVLDVALEASINGGLPSYQLSPAQGKFLHLLAKLQGARSILEIGTLGGYSTIWLARALPKEGRLISLELVPKHVEVARANIEFAGLSDKVEIRLGLALDSLTLLASEKREPFDFIFIDADKVSTPLYFTWALKLARTGTVIIVDNTVRNGGLSDATSDDPSIQGARHLHEMLRDEPRVSATTIQTVGSKGYDGFTMALVIA